MEKAGDCRTRDCGKGCTVFIALFLFSHSLSLFFFADQRKKEAVGEKDISIQSVFTDNCDTSLFFWVFFVAYTVMWKSLEPANISLYFARQIGNIFYF